MKAFDDGTSIKAQIKFWVQHSTMHGIQAKPYSCLCNKVIIIYIKVKRQKKQIPQNTVHCSNPLWLEFAPDPSNKVILIYI